MTIQEATREWFEMEGWDYVEEITYIHPSLDNTFWYNKLTDERIEGLPTIDANYFFDKVVGRMNGLGFTPGIGQLNGAWNVEWTQANSPYNHISEADDKDIVLAGLQAAIAARKEIK